MSNQNDADTNLDREISRLARDIRPQTDLWPRIEAELNPPKSRKTYQPRLAIYWATAASLLLVGILLLVNPLPPSDRESQLTAEVSAEAQVVTAYEAAIAAQIHVLHRADEYWGDVNYQLQVFRQAVTEIRYALSFHPHNQELLQQLQDVYQQQLAWLQAVSSYNSAVLSQGDTYV